MVKDLKHETLNDGVLQYGKTQPQYSSSREKIGEAFIAEGRLYFKLKSARDADNIVANGLGYRIDKKLKTHYRPELTSKHKVMIDGQTYDIKHLDDAKPYMYLYLQKVGV